MEMPVGGSREDIVAWVRSCVVDGSPLDVCQGCGHIVADDFLYETRGGLLRCGACFSHLEAGHPLTLGETISPDPGRAEDM